ncbi:MAG: hypothetical protein WCG10_04720, partial [Chlamydiota bacterium]
MSKSCPQHIFRIFYATRLNTSEQFSFISSQVSIQDADAAFSSDFQLSFSSNAGKMRKIACFYAIIAQVIYGKIKQTNGLRIRCSSDCVSIPNNLY